MTHRALGLATALTFGTVLSISTARIAGTMPLGAAPPLPDVKTLHYKTADLGPSWGAIASSGNYLNDNGGVLGILGPESVTVGKPILGLTGVWDAKQHWTPPILGANEARIEPAAFNNRGQFIGQSMDRRSLCSWILGDRNSHAYFRDTAAFRQFKSAGGEFDGIASINDSGEMLINADQKTSHGRAFILQNGHMAALKPQPGQKWSGVSAERLNASGWVAGCSGGHAALWKEGTPIDLGVLTGYDGSMATEVNASGDVAGELYHESDIGRSPFSGQRIHAFFWHSGKMEEIKPLPGGQYIQPTGMNDAGQVVGWSYSILSQHDPAHPNSFSVPATAFLWQDEKTYNLQQFLPATTDLRL